MGDRFYQQQLERHGTCVGFKGSKRRRKVAWTDESKAQAIEMYTAEDPTPETSMEIVKIIADELEESPNGVRMILTKAGVYVKKTPSRSTSTNGGGGRVSKAECHQMLCDAVEKHGGSLDMNIIDKISGKAAKHIAEQLNAN
jgi:hypothetical protein|tara:strand:- start:1006 stop:1431 length:426 start_codon:yes stop_codon:yes gene_type:complete